MLGNLVDPSHSRGGYLAETPQVLILITWRMLCWMHLMQQPGEMWQNIKWHLQRSSKWFTWMVLMQPWTIPCVNYLSCLVELSNSMNLLFSVSLGCIIPNSIWCYIMIYDSFSTWSLLFKVFVSIEKRGWLFHDSLVLVYQMLLLRLSLCVYTWTFKGVPIKP